ncbi:MAG: hypothetical protein DRG87_05140 [Deltaproteobacteria bacterium]|nr:hypothetical protein [Deltaproteobacteria bacterium]MBW2076227.1 hypothetical protein [Deltaproteobacteria bacterium]RLB30417.1 MAG: hypothetical protein DRG87_05140 [Deltaproteobacteria bacterium]
MAKKYRVVLLGVNSEEEAFRHNMARLGVSGSVLNGYIQKTPVVLVRDKSLADARRYAEAIINAGGLANIQETGEFPEEVLPHAKAGVPLQEDFTICPNCGLKQKRGERCARCGFDLHASPP